MLPFNRRLCRSLEDDLLGRPVFPQPLERPGTKQRLVGPAEELDLADKLGLCPPGALVGPGGKRSRKSRSRGVDGFERVAQRARLRAREAGAGAAGMDESFA